MLCFKKSSGKQGDKNYTIFISKILHIKKNRQLNYLIRTNSYQQDETLSYCESTKIFFNIMEQPCEEEKNVTELFCCKQISIGSSEVTQKKYQTKHQMVFLLKLY